MAGRDYAVSPLGQSEIVGPELSANQNNLEIDYSSITSAPQLCCVINTSSKVPTRVEPALLSVQSAMPASRLAPIVL